MGETKKIDDTKKDGDKVRHETGTGSADAVDLMGQPEARQRIELQPAPTDAALRQRLQGGTETLKPNEVKSPELSLEDAQKRQAASTEKTSIAGASAEVDRDSSGKILRIRTANGEISTEQVGDNKWVSTVKGQLVEFQAEGSFIEKPGELKFQPKTPREGAITDAQDMQKVLDLVGKVKVVDSSLGDVNAEVKAHIVGVTATGDLVSYAQEVLLEDGRTLERRPGENAWSVNFEDGEALRFRGNVVLKDGELRVVTQFPTHERLDVGIKVIVNGQELTINGANGRDILTRPVAATHSSIEEEALAPLRELIGKDSKLNATAVKSYMTREGRNRLVFQVELDAEQALKLNAAMAGRSDLSLQPEGTVKFEEGPINPRTGHEGAHESKKLGYFMTNSEISIVRGKENGLPEDMVAVMRRGLPPFQGELAVVGGFIEPGEDYETGRNRESREESGKAAKKGRLSGIYTVKNDPRSNLIADHVTVSELTLAEAIALRAGDDASGIKAGDPIARPISGRAGSYGLVPVREILANNRLVAFDYGRQLQHDAIYGLPQAERAMMKSYNAANSDFDIVGFEKRTVDGKEVRVPVIATKLDADGKPKFASAEELAKAFGESKFQRELGIKDAVLSHREGGRFVSAFVKEGQDPVKALAEVRAQRAAEAAEVAKAAELERAAQREEIEKTRIKIGENVVGQAFFDNWNDQAAHDYSEKYPQVKMREMPDGSVQMYSNINQEGMLKAVFEEAKTRDVVFRYGYGEFHVKAGSSPEDIQKAVDTFYEKSGEYYRSSPRGLEERAELERHYAENKTQARMDEALKSLPKLIEAAKADPTLNLRNLVMALGEISAMDPDGHAYNLLKGYDREGKAKIAEMLREAGFSPLEGGNSAYDSLETQARWIIGDAITHLEKGKPLYDTASAAKWFGKDYERAERLYSRAGYDPSDDALLRQLAGVEHEEATRYALDRVPAYDFETWSGANPNDHMTDARTMLTDLERFAKGDPEKLEFVKAGQERLNQLERDLNSSDPAVKFKALTEFEQIWHSSTALVARAENAEARIRYNRRMANDRIAGIGSGALNVVAMASILALVAKEGYDRMSESKKKELLDWARKHTPLQ